MWLINRVQAEFSSANPNVNSMQRELARIRESSSTGTTINSQAARVYIRVLTKLLGECSEEYTAVAGQADRNRADGLACEASYDAVRNTKPKE